MKDKHFTAILAKNDIAREIAAYKRGELPLNTTLIFTCLEQIEAWIGEGNQPSVENILDNNSREDRQFTI